jgi:3-oxoacyl-[acyl-carrier-protein] synthase-3
LFPTSKETLEGGMHSLYQDGKAVFKYAISEMTNAVEQIIQRNNINPQNISYLVPHQANKRIIDAIAKRIGLADDKVMSNIEYFGNTTAATLPLLLKDYESKLSPGDQLVFAAFGGGFTWGAAYLTWAY